MKRLIMLCLLFLMGTSAFAADLIVQWDAMPAGQTWSAVRVYELTGTTTVVYTKVGEVAVSNGIPVQLTVSNITPGSHRYIARSYDGVWESPDSNTILTPAVPISPANVRFSITFTITN